MLIKYGISSEPYMSNYDTLPDNYNKNVSFRYKFFVLPRFIFEKLDPKIFTLINNFSPKKDNDDYIVPKRLLKDFSIYDIEKIKKYSILSFHLLNLNYTYYYKVERNYDYMNHNNEEIICNSVFLDSDDFYPDLSKDNKFYNRTFNKFLFDLENHNVDDINEPYNLELIDDNTLVLVLNKNFINIYKQNDKTFINNIYKDIINKMIEANFNLSSIVKHDVMNNLILNAFC